MTDRFLPDSTTSGLATLPPPVSDLASLLGPEPALHLGYPDDPLNPYTPAPKFRKDEVLSNVDDLQADHSVRIAQTREFAKFLACTAPGYFKDDEDLIEDDIIETMPLLGGREEYEFRVGWLASHDPFVRMMGRDLLEHQEAMIVEDAAQYLFTREAYQYARQHHSDLSMAKAAHLLRCGMLAGIDVLDPDDPCGLSMDLLDPLTVFPVWGGPDGMLECYRVFEATNEDIIGSYGGRPGTKEYARIRDKVEKSAEKTKRGRRNVMIRNRTRTVVEAWSYDEMYVILDEEVELVRRAHGYRCVPITCWYGAFDQPVGMSIGTTSEYDEPTARSTDWGSVTISGRSMDLARQLAPYGWRHVEAHRIAEAVAGRDLTIFKWAINPTVVREYDPATRWQMSESLELLPGNVIDVPMPGKLNIVTPVIDQGVHMALAAAITSNIGGGFLTQMRMGAIPPQTSGSAMGKLQTMGGAADVGLVRAMQGFDRARTEKRLELLRVFGDSVGQPEMGMIRVPARAGSANVMHELTPDLLDRTGVEVEVEYYMWTPDLQMAQYFTTLRAPHPTTGRPLVSDETAQRRLKVTPDIEREQDRIDDEALTALPPIRMARDRARLEEELQKARDYGDHETAAALMEAIGELQFAHDLAIQAGQAAPPPGSPPGGQGAQTPPNVAPPGPPTPTPAMPGTSLPEQGIGVGTEGGRPPGAAGPSAMMPITAPPGGR